MAPEKTADGKAAAPEATGPKATAPRATAPKAAGTKAAGQKTARRAGGGATDGASDTEPKRTSRGLLAVSTQINRVTAALRQRRGLSEAGLLADWATIVGEDLAAECVPQRLVRGADGTGGALHVRVTGPLALELQHLEPLVIERINGYYGYRAVARLALRQGPLAPRPPKPAPRPVPDAAAEARLAPMLASVEDEELRDALARFGRGVLARQPARDDESD